MSQVDPRSALLLRPLKPADLPAVSQIENQVYEDPWNLSLLTESLTAAMTHTLAAFREDQLVAYAIYQVIFTDAHLLNLAVNPPWQHQGVGKYLLEQTMSDAERRGAFSLYLEVRPSNLRAKQLYEKNGFHSLTIREKYYPNGESAIVMMKDLV